MKNSGLAALKAIRPGRLAAADELLADRAALDRRYRADGLLYLRGVIDPELLRPVRDQVGGVLERWRVARRVGHEFLWTGVPLGPESDEQHAGPRFNLRELHDLPALRALSAQNARGAGPLKSLADAIYGCPTEVSGFLWIFVSIPDDSAFVTPPHEDDIRPEVDNRRLWMPLTDIEFADGGLAFALGSHAAGSRHRVALPGYRMRSGPDPVAIGTPFEEVTQPWATASFSRGDAVMFHSHAVHAGLPHVSDRVRMALSAFVTLQGHNLWGHWSVSEREDHWRAALEIASALGASEVEADAAGCHLFKEEIVPDRESVRLALAQVGSRRTAGSRRLRVTPMMKRTT